MIGFILVTHTHIGKEMMRAVEEILKEKTTMLTVGFDPGQSLEKTRTQIRAAMEKLSDREGIIILTDLFGATPSNLCRELCQTGRVEMLSGCNLPIVLKAATGNFEKDVTQTIQFLREYGKDKIQTCCQGSNQ